MVGADLVDTHRVLVTIRFTFGALVDVQTAEIVVTLFDVSVRIGCLKSVRERLA